MKETIETNVDIEQQNGPLSLESRAEGSLIVSGPKKFAPDTDAHVSISISHGGDAIEVRDDSFPTTDWGRAGVTLSMQEVEDLYWALNDIMYNEEPDVLIEDWETEEE